MKYVVFSGGKRLRPILTIESAGIFKGSAKKAMPFACAIELIHNFSLVHDDLPCMDNDDTRRGKPTCHKKFGESTAVLTGDALFNLAFGVLARVKHKKTTEIIARISDAVGAENMVGGQVLDLIGPASRKIDAMKTAALMGVSCEAGALAAGAKAADAGRMRRFGLDLGLAFQIADDIEDGQSASSMKGQVAILVAKAKKNIACFGKRAEALSHIADSVLGKACKSF